MLVTQNGNRVVYRAPTGSDGRTRLLYVDTAQPGDETVVSDAISSASVLSFSLSTDGQSAVYESITESGEEIGAGSLSHVLLGSPSTVVNISPPDYEYIEDYVISSDGETVLYKSSGSYSATSKIFVVHPNVATTRTEIQTGLVDYTPTNFTNSLTVSEVTDKVYFIGNYDNRYVYELYEASTGTPQTITKVSSPLDSSIVDNFKVSPDGAYIVYSAVATLSSASELYLVDLSNPGVSVKITPTMAAFGSVRDYVLASDGVYFVADSVGDDTFDLYDVKFATPNQLVKLTNMPAGRGVTDFASHPTGSVLAYRGNQDTEDVYGLYIVDLASPGITTLVTQIGDSIQAGSIKISPDNLFVVYNRDRALRMASLDGLGTESTVSATPVLGGAIFNDYVIDTDNNLVFFRGDVTTDNRNEVYMATLAAPSVTTRLNVAVGPSSDVFEFQVNSDATALVFRADVQTGRNLLYIVQLDTPGVQTLLSLPSSSTARDVFEFQLTDSGVIYRGDLVSSSRHEVYRSEFSSPGTATTLVQMRNPFDVDTFRVSGSNVFYRADPIRSNVSEILYVDSDIPQVTTTLTPFPAATNIENLQAF